MISTHAPSGVLVAVLLVCLAVGGPVSVVGFVADVLARRAYTDSDRSIIGDGFPGDGFFPAKARGDRYSGIAGWSSLVCAVLAVIAIVTLIVIGWQSVDIHLNGTTGHR